jgi:hypothetical protein
MRAHDSEGDGMSEDTKPNDTMSMSLYGPGVTPEIAAEAAGHLGNLIREITREVCGDPDAIKWEIGAMRWRCDGCGSEEPEKPATWINVGSLDYCPACQLSFVAVSE